MKRIGILKLLDIIIPEKDDKNKNSKDELPLLDEITLEEIKEANVSDAVMAELRRTEGGEVKLEVVPKDVHEEHKAEVVQPFSVDEGKAQSKAKAKARKAKSAKNPNSLGTK